jgi:small subunit ribosomal protein S13
LGKKANIIFKVILNMSEDEKDQKAYLKPIVRVANEDIMGNKRLYAGIASIKGISFSLANAICNVLGIDRDMRIGHLKEEQIKKIEGIIKNPAQHGIPEYMLNLRNEPETGQSKILVGPEIRFYVDQIKKTNMRLKTYRGSRYNRGLPVRGQRTRSNFRRNKGKAMGVSKKKGQPAPKQKTDNQQSGKGKKK